MPEIEKPRLLMNHSSDFEFADEAAEQTGSLSNIVSKCFASLKSFIRSENKRHLQEMKASFDKSELT